MGHKLKRPVGAQYLANVLGLTMFGHDRMIAGVAPFNQAASQDLTFTKLGLPMVPTTIVITNDPATHMKPDPQTTVLVSDNPRRDFIRALEHLDAATGFIQPDFESRIHPSVELGQGVAIEDGCDIGEGVKLGHNVVVHTGSKIGKNSVIRSGAIIGAEGFGFARLPSGKPVRFVHLAGVSIGQNVEIGSNNTICRGTLNDTVVEDNVKTDSLVHIGHNCQIRSGVFITACAELSGGVTIGENAWVGPNVSIIEKVTIGEGAFIGIGSVVISDVPNDSVFVGNPAKFLRLLK